MTILTHPINPDDEVDVLGNAEDGFQLRLDEIPIVFPHIPSAAIEVGAPGILDYLQQISNALRDSKKVETRLGIDDDFDIVDGGSPFNGKVSMLIPLEELGRIFLGVLERENPVMAIAIIEYIEQDMYNREVEEGYYDDY